MEDAWIQDERAVNLISTQITAFFSISSLAASNLAWMTPAAFVAASRSQETGY